MKFKNALILGITEIWFIAGMFFGVGTYLLTSDIILSLLLYLFSLGFALITIFLLMVHYRLYGEK